MSVPVLSGPDTPVVGTVVISRAQFRNNAGVLTDPDPVTFTVRSPSGVESTYQYTGGSDVTGHIVRNSVGDYQVAFEGTEPDWWDVEWQAEGALTIVGDGRALFRRQLDSSFIASPHCTIADIYYNADETPYAGAVIQAYWVNTPVLRAAGGVLANKHREIVADANGAWSADFIWASASYPTTTAVMLAFPRGERIAGIVPSITGPITLTELLAAPYNWAPVKPSQSVTVVQGPAGMKWRGDWDPFTAYHPNDVAQYGGSSWIALANSTDVIPGTDSTKWELVASVEGALAGGDLTGAYLSPSLDLTKSHSWQGIQTGPFRDKGGARFNAKAYGAVGDGTTDDTAAVQAAWTAAAAVGGITYLPAGTYAVDPATLGAPPTALHLLGDGYQSSLKVKDGAGDFRSLLIWSGAATGVTIRNLRFDGNASGYGGTIQSNTGAGDYESRTARMLLFSGAATDVSVTDCWFTNTCGVHVMIANNASNARVRFDRNTVIWSMNAANISGGLDYDNSMVYIAGPAHITGNSFIHPTIPAPPYGARGALETIGGPVVVANNLFQNFRTPLYALGSFAFPTSGSVGESVISGNTISGANQAIRLWPSTQGGKISVTGNQIRIAQVTHNRLNCCGIWVEDDPTFISPIGEVTITGNTVTFEDESPAGRATDYQGSALTATDCIGIGAPSFNTVSGLSIIGNVIKGAPAYGIALGRSNTARASTMRNVLARNNQIINAGQNIALGNTSRAGIFLTANCENVKIASNQISDVWGAFSTLPYSNAVAGTFLSSQQYWFAFDLTGAAGTSQGNNPIALTPQTNNTQIKLGIRLDNANITSVGIYADTTATPKRVGTIAVSYSGTAWTVGAITYDGTSSGLSAAVSGSGLTTSVLTVTLSDPQSGSSIGAAGTNGTGSGATAIPLTRQFYGIFAGASGTSYTNVHVEDNGLYISAPLHGGGVRLQTSLPASIIVEPLTTIGDIGYISATGPPATITRLPVGSASQVLIGGAIPNWGSVPDAALSANVALDNVANVFSAVQTISVTDAGTNTEPTLLTIRHRSSGTAAVGFGSSLAFSADSNSGTLRGQSSLVSSWLDAGDGTRRGIIQLFVNDATTAREGLRVASNGTAAQVGFFGHSGAIRPSVAGALSAVTDVNAKTVLQNLINALKTASGGVGLVADTTT